MCKYNIQSVWHFLEIYLGILTDRVIAATPTMRGNTGAGVIFCNGI